MTNGSAEAQGPRDQAEEPTTEELEQPSTEKAPGDEPKADKPAEPEPSHEAVGIGVIGRPLVEPESSADPASPAERD